MATAAEARKDNIEKMGEPLGVQYSALWQAVTQLYWFWLEFVELFGTKKSRTELLNRSAPNFFHMVQETLWEATMLHLCRLTDPCYTRGKKTFANLTIQNLPELIDDATQKEKVNELVKIALEKTEFCRDWRNRRLAHTDLDLAINEQATPLASADVKNTTAALESIAAVLNSVQIHYKDSQTAYDFATPHQGAVTLLYYLYDGIKSKEKRIEKLKRGELPDDEPRDL
jgi:hypothetical protein